MSRARLYKVIKDRVYDGLRARNSTLKDFANSILVDYAHLNKSINNAGITYPTLDALARYIDRAPEYLTGETDNPFLVDDTVFSYVFHERQSLNTANTLRPFMIYSGENPDDYTPRELKKIYFHLVTALNDICGEIQNQKKQDSASREEAQ